jgi:hypothetical protein
MQNVFTLCPPFPLRSLAFGCSKSWANKKSEGAEVAENAEYTQFFLVFSVSQCLCGEFEA